MKVNSPPTRRGPGRPRGLPKTGGRKAGTPNRVSGELRDTIARKYKPLDFLGRVVLGLRIRTGPQAGPGEPHYVYPSLKDRMEAARTLASKILPDLKANEVTGKDGERLIPTPQPVKDEDFKLSLIALWKQANT